MTSRFEDVCRRVGDALRPLEAIRLAYLFGSRARGTARPDSDLDIAVLYDPTLKPEQRLRVHLDAIAALTDALGFLGEHSDVVDLDSASSAVAFRAIRDGRCVLERDRTERVRLEARVARLYDDEAPRREIIRQGAIRSARRLGATVPGRS